jgi:3-hydroxybutyryl-CoA dehydrogenase
MNINRVCVCGAGTMGSGIAQAAAHAGLRTLLYDLDVGTLEKAKSSIEKSLHVLAEKGKISTAEKEEISSRIGFTNDIHDCTADVVIEAIVEKAAIKIALFNQLAAINSGETIFATNTSSLSVASIAAGIANPGRIVGMHFFNPATIMKLVEIINTEHTLPATTDTVVQLAKRMGKVPVICKDSPGFIVNRVARPYYIEALRLAEENITNFEQADRLLEVSGFKMGPFKLMDLIGNDINYAVSCSVYEQMGQPERLRPSFIQQEKVATGQLGRKTKKGYYNYE